MVKVKLFIQNCQILEDGKLKWDEPEIRVFQTAQQNLKKIWKETKQILCSSKNLVKGGCIFKIFVKDEEDDWISMKKEELIETDLEGIDEDLKFHLKVKIFQKPQSKQQNKIFFGNLKIEQPKPSPIQSKPQSPFSKPISNQENPESKPQAAPTLFPQKNNIFGLNPSKFNPSPLFPNPVQLKQSTSPSVFQPSNAMNYNAPVQSQPFNAFNKLPATKNQNLFGLNNKNDNSMPSSSFQQQPQQQQQQSYNQFNSAKRGIPLDKTIALYDDDEIYQ